MKIGIITFHWSTNYGAILQAYCLQEQLVSMGHDVEILNYKPHRYDFSWRGIVRHPKLLLSLSKILRNNKKEKLLDIFRREHLNLTCRYCLTEEMELDAQQYDIIFSGSDQILNAHITMTADEGNPSSAYFLGFASERCKKIGYAVSFGCDSYPDFAKPAASRWINIFDHVSVREQSGLDILRQLGYEGPSSVVPDPTFFLTKSIFERFGMEKREKEYLCVYMLRWEIKMKDDKVKYLDAKHAPLSMQQWLSSIINSKGLITNSFHGMLMAIFAHIPFAVLLEEGSGAGMNDRFVTTLGRLNLKDRIVSSVEDAMIVVRQGIDYDKVDESVAEYRQTGVDFLQKCCNGDINITNTTNLPH